MRYVFSMSRLLKNTIIVLAATGLAFILYVLMQSLAAPKADRNPLEALAKGEMKELVLLKTPPAQPMEPFEGPDGAVTLADFRGKTVLLNLWASWCAPCVAELPSLDRLQGELGDDGFMVLTINMDRSKKEALAFLAKTDIKNLPLYHDNRFAIAQKLSVPGLPSGLPITVLYDKNGIERARLSGGADWNGPEAHALIAAVQESARR